MIGPRLGVGNGQWGQTRLIAIDVAAPRSIESDHIDRSVAEVDVELIEADDGRSPHHSLEDTYKLDDVREALRRGDVKVAVQHGKVYTLAPVAM